LDQVRYLEGQIAKALKELNLAEVDRFDKLNSLDNLSLNTRKNYLQRLLEFSRAARSLYNKHVTELCFDEIVDILDRLKKGEVSTRLSGRKKKLSDRAIEYHIVTLKKFFASYGNQLANMLKTPSRKAQTQKPTIPEDEIRQLIAKAPSLLERLVIELLYETGAREGELANLRLKDIVQDEYSFIVHLHGKTGSRPLRVFLSKPDLATYVNQHPCKDDGNATLLLSEKERVPLGELGIYRLVTNLTQKILGKRYNPHLFRHTVATRYARDLTEHEMKLFFGWKRAESAAPYVHLAMRDLDKKILGMHGIRREGSESHQILQPTTCWNCKAPNSPYSVFCSECSRPLGYTAENSEALRHLQKRLEELERRISS